MKTIDRNRPIRFVGQHDRPCLLVGYLAMPGKPEVLLVQSVYGYTPGHSEWEEPRKFNLDGTCADATKSLVIENVPQRDSTFWPLGNKPLEPYGRGLIDLLFAKSDYPAARFFIEIVTEDKVPVEAKIHAR